MKTILKSLRVLLKVSSLTSVMPRFGNVIEVTDQSEVRDGFYIVLIFLPLSGACCLSHDLTPINMDQFGPNR